MAVTTEQLLDKIATGLIENMHVIAEGTELATLQENHNGFKLNHGPQNLGLITR